MNWGGIRSVTSRLVVEQSLHYTGFKINSKSFLGYLTRIGRNSTPSAKMIGSRGPASGDSGIYPLRLIQAVHHQEKGCPVLVGGPDQGVKIAPRGPEKAARVQSRSATLEAATSNGVL
jgi:hypothetical protein